MPPYYARPRVGGASPWGPIQSVEQVHGSNGELLFVSTAGHGGYWMGPEYLATFHRKLPEFEGFAGLPWLEEDCDAAVAVIVFPDLFSPEAHRRATEAILAPALDTYFSHVRERLALLLPEDIGVLPEKAL